MNREDRRRQERLERKREAEEIQRIQKRVKRTVSKAIEDDRQRLVDKHGLDENGRGFTSWVSENDTIGSFGTMGVETLSDPIAIATVTAKEQKVLASVLEGLDRLFDRLDMPYVAGFEGRVRYGGQLELIISQRQEELWYVYLGKEGTYSKVIEQGLVDDVRENGRFIHSNEWEVRLKDPSTIYQFENALNKLEFAIFFARERVGTAESIPGYDVFIPKDNVQIRFLPK